MKILLIEDDGRTAGILAEALTIHHYRVDQAADGQTGLELAKDYNYDLIVLDIILPVLDGISVCRQLRSGGHQMPILLLSGKDSSTDRVMGLEAGADDYVVKPYDLPELVARIRALLRRGSFSESGVLTWEKLELDPDATLVTYDGKQLHLTPKEYSLLELFLRHPQRLFSRSVILDRIWSSDEFPGEEAVTTQIKGLRQKLKAAGIRTNLIETVYGLGYRLRTPPDKEKEKTTQRETKTPNPPISSSPNPQPPIEQSDAEAKVMAMVAVMWEPFKESMTDAIALFEQALASLATGTLDHNLRYSAISQAHRLIGSLGTFGLSEGSHVARQIEQLLQAETHSQDRCSTGCDVQERLEELVRLLKQSMEKKPSAMTATSPATPATPARLLVIDDDTLLTERLKVEATAWGLQVDVATNLTTARNAIALLPPDVILLDLTFPETEENGLTLLAQLRHKNPEIPVLVFTAQSQLNKRVEVARLGAYTFLQKPIPPDVVFQAVKMALNEHNTVEGKVMVVDDDPLVLAHLRALGAPWGLQVTTLEDPQRFWDILESTNPDLLILDVEMPGYSGIELCQVVRNDPSWSHLPILFLSAHANAQLVHQGFAVGADDYVTKPIAERELIDRIFTRLERNKVRHQAISPMKLKNLSQLKYEV